MKDRMAVVAAAPTVGAIGMLMVKLIVQRLKVDDIDVPAEAIKELSRQYDSPNRRYMVNGSPEVESTFSLLLDGGLVVDFCPADGLLYLVVREPTESGEGDTIRYAPVGCLLI